MAAPSLRFLGAAGTVTGSRFLVEGDRARVLVDCGLFQGLKPLRLRNWDPFPVEPSAVDAVLLSHAHVDHSGYLPALWRQGFRGRVWCTPATRDLCRIVLRDAGRLQEEDAAYANRKGFSKHRPALPLYDEEDAKQVLERFETLDFGASAEVAQGVSARFQRAGHILGSAGVTLDLDGPSPRRLFVSGDVGRPDHPLLLPPAPPPSADVLLVESTYGDRLHGDDDAVERFARVLAETAERGGVAVVPAFAVDRTEILLFHLRELVSTGRIPSLPIYVDSPMALAALEVYRRAVAEGSQELRPELRGRPAPFDPGRLVEAHGSDESRAIHEVGGPAIIVSASGMATGGRVLHHLARRLPDPHACIVLTGFQAAGTRGRRLLEGEETIKMLGRWIPVRARIENLSAFSVHADRGELLEWLAGAPAAPGTAWVVHGEAKASQSLRGAIEEQLGWRARLAEDLQQVEIVAAAR